MADYITTLNKLLLYIIHVRDDLKIRSEIEEVAEGKEQPPVLLLVKYLSICAVNCWTKLDEYFYKCDKTPALYVSVVCTPYIK